MSILKVKDWAKNKNQQFEIVFGLYHEIYLRLKDKTGFREQCWVDTAKGVGKLRIFYPDLITVEVEIVLSGDNFSFEINDIELLTTEEVQDLIVVGD